jgi:hypothetical protein
MARPQCEHTPCFSNGLANTLIRHTIQKGLGNGIQGKVTKIMGPGQSAPLNHGTWIRETTQPWDGQGRPPNHGTWTSVHKGTWMLAETASESPRVTACVWGKKKTTRRQEIGSSRSARNPRLHLQSGPSSPNY